MSDPTAGRPIAVVTASGLARDGARVRQLTRDGWVLVTRRGTPAGAVVALTAVRDAIDWTDSARFVSARDLSRTGAVSDVLDAAAAGDVRVLTEHNRPVAAIVSAAPFVDRLRRALDAAQGLDPNAGGGKVLHPTDDMKLRAKAPYKGYTASPGWMHGPEMPA